MSDYTPSLEEVREDYKLFAGDGEDRAKAHAEFDRMIIAHDEAVRAEEREKAAQIAESLDFGAGGVAPANRWGAKQAAARIREQGKEQGS